MYALEMIDIDKNFDKVHAVDHVDFRVKDGEMHGLIGENGAGKTTLMNILYGFVKPDSGKIKLFGKEVEIHSALDAIKHGVGMVHQHFMLASQLTALQNIVLGNTAKDKVFVDLKKARAKVQEIMDTYGLHVDLDAKVYQLSVGERQRIEIIKILYKGAKLLIFDEPTAVLTPPETKHLIEVMHEMNKRGCSIIFITHKLKEVLAIADNITVMRKGVVTGRVQAQNTNEAELSQLMVGHIAHNNLPRADFHPGEEVFRAEKLVVKNIRNLIAVKGVDFSIHKGEIVGIAGVEGNGQTEIAKVVSGQVQPVSGNLYFENNLINKKSIRQRREMGISHIPEDRLKVGVALRCSIEDNLNLNTYYRPPIASHGIMNLKTANKNAEGLVDKFGIKVPSAKYAVKTLSGGNMQKVIYAREIDSNPDLLIAAQPTRGVDIGAIEFMHTQLLKLRDEGKAILLISAELSEIFELADRILVMYEGEFVAEFPRGRVSEDEIGLYMSGAKRMTEEEWRAVNG